MRTVRTRERKHKNKDAERKTNINEEKKEELLTEKNQ